MAPTPPTQSAGASNAQPSQDERLTSFLRWFTGVCTAISTATLCWLAVQFVQTRDNQLRIGIIVEGLSARVAKVENDSDKKDEDYRKLLEQTQLHRLAIQQIQSQIGLR